jgi:nicotinamidase-related amidase
MNTLKQLSPQQCAVITIDCLTTFMKASGALSISAYQRDVLGLDHVQVQREVDGVGERIAAVRQALFESKIPQIQFQDAHVIESVHGKRFHSMELIREGETPDFVRSFPPHALLDHTRRFGTEDQQAIPEIKLHKSREVLIRWFDDHLPVDAELSSTQELIFMKDDFCMAPGNPYLDRLFWELRRQGRTHLIIMGVCDEICNLRNVLLMLSALFNILYVEDATYPLDPTKRELALDYMRSFNPLGQVQAGQWERVTSHQLLARFG